MPLPNITATTIGHGQYIIEYVIAGMGWWTFYSNISKILSDEYLAVLSTTKFENMFHFYYVNLRRTYISPIIRIE